MLSGHLLPEAIRHWIMVSLLEKVDTAASPNESLAESGDQSQTQTVPALPMLDTSALPVAATHGED